MEEIIYKLGKIVIISIEIFGLALIWFLIIGICEMVRETIKRDTEIEPKTLSYKNHPHTPPPPPPPPPPNPKRTNGCYGCYCGGSGPKKPTPPKGSGSGAILSVDNYIHCESLEKLTSEAENVKKEQVDVIVDAIRRMNEYGK